MFMLTDRPVMYPSTTLLGNAGGPVVDTGIDMLVGGRVYIDRVEAGMITQPFGFATPEEVAKLRDQLAAERAKNEQLRAQLAHVGEIVREAVAAA